MKHLIYIFSMVLLFATACKTDKTDNGAEEQEAKIISKPDLKLTSDVMTPEVLWSFGRLGDVQVSPDEKTLLFGISYYDIQENKGNRELVKN